MEQSEIRSADELSMPFFISSLSHEIRTPLNGVVGYSQLLAQTKLSTVQKTYISSMNKCCIQLMELINDIIDYSKLTVGKMKVKNDCFSLKEVIDVVNNTMHCRFKEKQQTCHYAISRNLPDYIVSDKQKLIQVLINLLSNANKFSKIKGFISVHISPKQQNILEFTVKDTGIGISKEDQARLFNVFFQAGAETKSGFSSSSGSGLGLAISKKIVNILGGEMHVTSVLGQGSSFSFTIHHDTQDNFQKDIEVNLPILKDKYILVVNADMHDRIILGELLFGWRMRPVVCASGQEAFRMIQQDMYNFSMAIIDVHMSDMSGVELANKVKLECPTFPIIGLSSTMDVISTDFDHILYKPLNKTQLLSTIQKILNGNMKSIRLDSEEEIVHVKNPDMRILIAEDNDINMDLLCTMLNLIGYKNLDRAENGQIAVNMIDNAYESKEPYSMILLDLRMPVLNGFDVIDHIKAKDYTIHTVVITASTLESDKAKCAQKGIKYFISKPFSIGQIREVSMIAC